MNNFLLCALCVVFLPDNGGYPWRGPPLPPSAWAILGPADTGATRPFVPCFNGGIGFHRLFPSLITITVTIRPALHVHDILDFQRRIDTREEDIRVIPHTRCVIPIEHDTSPVVLELPPQSPHTANQATIFRSCHGARRMQDQREPRTCRTSATP